MSEKRYEFFDSGDGWLYPRVQLAGDSKGYINMVMLHPDGDRIWFCEHVTKRKSSLSLFDLGHPPDRRLLKNRYSTNFVYQMDDVSLERFSEEISLLQHYDKNVFLDDLKEVKEVALANKIQGNKTEQNY